MQAACSCWNAVPWKVGLEWSSATNETYATNYESIVARVGLYFSLDLDENFRRRNCTTETEAALRNKRVNESIVSHFVNKTSRKRQKSGQFRSVPHDRHCAICGQTRPWQHEYLSRVNRDKIFRWLENRLTWSYHLNYSLSRNGAINFYVKHCRVFRRRWQAIQWGQKHDKQKPINIITDNHLSSSSMRNSMN